MEELQQFIDDWKEDEAGIRSLFISLAEYGRRMPKTTVEFKARPGISYSLRLTHDNQKERPLFVLVDVIDDAPDARWLSVCFFADMIASNDEGDIVPGGLFGADACCFDVDEADDTTAALLKTCLDEAHAAASLA